MFRRRALIRAVGRSMMPNVPPLLRRANELMNAGDYLAAAEAFEQLAHGALARGIPRGPFLFIQAGRARVLADQVPAGMEHFKQGLTLFANLGQTQMLDNHSQRIIAELKQRGLTVEASEIEELTKTHLPAGFTRAAVEEKPKILPTQCTGCGAPMRANEVEWVDEVTAECPYCGSAVRAE